MSHSWRETQCWCVWIVSKTTAFGQSRCEYLLKHNFSCFLTFLSTENLKIVNLQGRLKSNKKLASELSFDFCIESVGKL